MTTSEKHATAIFKPPPSTHLKTSLSRSNMDSFIAPVYLLAYFLTSIGNYNLSFSVISMIYEKKKYSTTNITLEYKEKLEIDSVK